jgi:isopenicillin N synthase-like dioxygenase
VRRARGASSWIAAPPVDGSFVCNIGDMLDRMTRGVFRSTAHRARNPASTDRLSFPFFLDPGFATRVQPLDLPDWTAPPDDAAERWDRASVHAFEGTYGDYLLAKVGKVFPELRRSIE